jgi:hypothetical protein
MKKRSWQQALRGASGTLVLLALPALALLSFGPCVLRAFATCQRGLPSAAAAARLAIGREAPASAQVLDRWQDTGSTIVAAFNISLGNNREISALEGVLATLVPGSTSAVAAQINLGLVTATSTAFEANYKLISKNSTPIQNANLVSGYLNGEMQAFSFLANAPSTDPFTQAMLSQKANLLAQQIAVFENWFFMATSKKFSNHVIAANLNLFSTRLLQSSLDFTAFQVQEYQSGMISSSKFTFVSPF